MDDRINKSKNSCVDKCESCKSCEYKTELKEVKSELLEARRIIGEIAIKQIKKQPAMWVNKD